MTTWRVVLAIIVLQSTASSQEPRRVNPDSTDTKPVYREPQKGEERVEGLLQRVECPTGKPVSFVVKVKDRAEKYEAARLGDVEYIAHTPDFKGPMSCGCRGAGDPVILTWKKSGAARRVVAIEFTPGK
jgi:hypothetical protein